MSKASKVDHLALYRRTIDFEVARVYEGAGRRVNRYTNSIRDGVVHANHLNVHATEFYTLAGLHDVQLGLVVQVMLLELASNQANGERRTVDRHIKFLQQVWNRADVILVAVSDDQTFDFVHVLLDVRKVRNDKIDAEHFAVREGHAAVEDEHIAFALEQCDILADLIQATQERHSNGRLRSFPARISIFLLGYRLALRRQGVVFSVVGGFPILSRLLFAGCLHIRICTGTRRSSFRRVPLSAISRRSRGCCPRCGLR